MKRLFLILAVLATTLSYGQKKTYEEKAELWKLLYGLELEDTLYVPVVKFDDGTVLATGAFTGSISQAQLDSMNTALRAAFPDLQGTLDKGNTAIGDINLTGWLNIIGNGIYLDGGSIYVKEGFNNRIHTTEDGLGLQMMTNDQGSDIHSYLINARGITFIQQLGDKPIVLRGTDGGGISTSQLLEAWPDSSLRGFYAGSLRWETTPTGTKFYGDVEADAFSHITDSLADHLTRIFDLRSRVEALEAAPPGYSDADIDGSETAFDGWDKNAADDFSGDYVDLVNKPALFDGLWSSLTGVPADIADGDDVGAAIDDNNSSSTTTYSSNKINSLIGSAGGGDMVSSMYDPTGVNGDAFDWNNMHSTSDVVQKSTVGANTILGTIVSDNDNNAHGPNFDAQTTTKSVSEYAYKVTRGGSTVGGFRVDGRVAIGATVIGSNNVINWNTAYGWGNFKDYGLGTIGITQNSLSFQDSLPDEFAFYRATTGGTSVTGLSGVSINMPYGGGRGVQLFFNNTGGVDYRNASTPYNWSPIKHLWDDSDFNINDYALSSNVVRNDGSLQYVSGWKRFQELGINVLGSCSIPADSSGWYRIAEFSSSSRGGGEVIISYTGGDFTPTTFVIRYFKNWSNVATLTLEHLGANQYLDGVRIMEDTTNGKYYLEANFRAEVVNHDFDIYHSRLAGHNAGVTILTGALSKGADNGVRLAYTALAHRGVSSYRFRASNSFETQTHSSDDWSAAYDWGDHSLAGYATQNWVTAQAFATVAALNAHTTDMNNPHGVDKTQVGLGNVDNTSDADKPISTATQTALNAKADKSNTYTKAEVSDLTDDNKERIDKLFFERYQLTASRNFEATDVWTRQYNLGAAAVVLTIPMDFTDMEAGDQIILQAIGGDIVVDPDSGVTLTSGSGSGTVSIKSPCAARVLEKIGTNEYVIYDN